MDSGSIRLAPQAVPQFNSAGGVMSEIQGELSNLQSLWGQLNSLMKELAAAQNDKPTAQSTEGKSEEEVKKMQEDFEKAMTDWSSRVEQLQGRVEDVQKQIEDSTRKLASLQNVKLPQAQAKDRSDTERWMDDQRRNMEAISSSTSDSGYSESVGGDDNVAIIRGEIAAIQQKNAMTQVFVKASQFAQVVNTEARPEVTRTLGRMPPRNDGLTIG